MSASATEVRKIRRLLLSKDTHLSNGDISDAIHEEPPSRSTLALADSAQHATEAAHDSVDDDGGWSFEEEEANAATVDDATSVAAPGPRRANGHRRNISQLSTRSKDSRTSKASRASQGKASLDDGEDEDAAGWSFDAEDDDEAMTLEMPEMPSEQAQKAGHSRKSSVEEAWGWTAEPLLEDDEEDRPIGKPTKVIKSRRFGATGRADSIATSELSPAEHTALPDLLSQPSDALNTNQMIPPKEQQAQLNISTQVPEIKEPASQKEQTALLVSTRSKRVCQVAQELLDAALAVSSPRASLEDFAATAKILLKSFSDTFDLYRAIMPVAHISLIETVPSIGMQFSNDCIYIARDGSRLAQERVSPSASQSLRLTQSEKEAVKRPFESLRLFGHRLLHEQIELQRVPLMETLDEVAGLKDTDDPGVFAQCQRCVRQLVHTLTSISHAWKPVLLKRVYFESMGILVNAVLLRILVEIENQEDISEVASHRLNELCKMMHDLEGLFIDETGESTVALHVPVWFKFKFLSELLEASMADIMFLFNEGHLVDFSSTELSKLVRALFAESQLRQRNLDTIARVAGR